MSRPRAVVVLLSLIAAGCGSGDVYRSHGAVSEGRNASNVAPSISVQPPASSPAVPAKTSPAVTHPERKIIFNAGVELVVENFSATEEAVLKLVHEQGGYLAKSNMEGGTGPGASTARWTLRVPVDRFTTCLSSVSRLGELKSSTVDSSDITDQYYDLEAHIKSNLVEEEGLQKFLLEKSAHGTLEEILTIRKEIRIIRSEIDRQQGQLQRWGNDTAFATLSVMIYQKLPELAFVAPAEPSFLQKIHTTFFISYGMVVALGQEVILIVVALVPWIPMILGVVVGLWLWTPGSRVSSSQRNS